MAADAYLHAAAAQLESAANEIRYEIDRIRGDFASFEQQASREIFNKEENARALLAQAASAADPPGGAHLAMLSRNTRKEAEELKRQIDERRKQLDKDVQGKMKAIDGLMGQARGLHSSAANYR